MLRLRSYPILLGFLVGFASATLCQTVSQPATNVTLGGIVLSSDHRCIDAREPRDPLCRASDWALASGRTIYLLYGDPTVLHSFEHQRVRIKGTLEERRLVQYGTPMVRRQISVRAIESSELPDGEIARAMEELKAVPWSGPTNVCSPMCWNFAFTAPMLKILDAGRKAQHVLLEHVNDPDIGDQVVMLLGGLGDENAVQPIIGAMADGEQARVDPQAKRMNLVANIALTTLTVSDVIWHHGGGISVDKCPNDPKSCWAQWWDANKGSFKVGGGDRLYSNYPNYGIFAQFDDASFQ